MNMAFNVGDKVRFTDACPRAWFFGPERRFKTGVVLSTDGYYNRTYKVAVDGHDQPASVDDEHIELIVNTPAQATVTFYTLVYRTRGSAARKIAGFEGEGQFEEEKAAVVRQGGTIVSSKKIKLTNV